MNKELMEKLIAADYMEIVDNQAKRAFINSITGPSFQGWDYYLVYDEDGFSLVGPFSQGTQTFGMYNGTQIVLSRISAYRELGTVITGDIFDDLQDKEEFVDFLEEEYENYSREEIEDYTFGIDYDGAYFQFNNDQYNRLIEEYAVAEWDVYMRDAVVSEIELNIDHLKDVLE